MQSPAAMIAWSACFLCVLMAGRALLEDLGAPGGGFFALSRERSGLARVTALLQELEETLATGLVPAPERWAALRALPDPWGSLVHESLQELRSRGGALLPTMRRLRELASSHGAALADARARSAQALAQALACAVLIPVFGALLRWLLPGVAERPWSWLSACAGALALSGSGALWMLSLAERARWAGLAPAQRPWILAAQCAGERFLALVRAGTPADLAWARACELLAREAPGLAALWGPSIWGEAAEVSGLGQGATGALAQAGASLRKAVQVSLMEGRPCADRIEAAISALRQELRALVERELGMLGTRALKPLFACVAPSLFLLLAFGLWLGWEQAAGGILAP